MIETPEQYVRTQQARWQFYGAVLENRRSPAAELMQDPAFSHVYEQAMLSQIEDLEQELAEYEQKNGGPWVAQQPK